MGFKQSPFPMVSGTTGHSSALKKASALKQVKLTEEQQKNIDAGRGANDPGEQKAKKIHTVENKPSTPAEGRWARMHRIAGEKDPRYAKMSEEEYKKEALRQVKHKKEHGTYDAMGTETKARKKDTDEKAKADAKVKADAKAKADTEVRKGEEEHAKYKKTFETKESRLAARAELRKGRKGLKAKLKAGEITQADYDKQRATSKAESKKYRQAGESKLATWIRKGFEKAADKRKNKKDSPTKIYSKAKGKRTEY